MSGLLTLASSWLRILFEHGLDLAYGELYRVSLTGKIDLRI